MDKGSRTGLVILLTTFQIETIGIFLDGCKKYGMDEKDLFVSLDLHEEQNKSMVRKCEPLDYNILYM